METVKHNVQGQMSLLPDTGDTFVCFNCTHSKSTSSGKMIEHKAYSKYVTPTFSLKPYSRHMRDVPAGYCCSKRHRNTMISATTWCMNHPRSWCGSSVQNVGPFYGERHLGVRVEADSSCLCLRCMSLTSLVHHQDVHPAACADFVRCRSTCSTHRPRPRNPHLHMHQHHRHAAATLTIHPRARDCRLTWMQE